MKTAKHSQAVLDLWPLAAQFLNQAETLQDLTFSQLAAFTGQSSTKLRKTLSIQHWRNLCDAWVIHQFQHAMEVLYAQARTREDFAAARIASHVGVSRVTFMRLMKTEWQQRRETLPTPQEHVTRLVWQLVEDNTPLEHFTRAALSELVGVKVTGYGTWFKALYRTAYLILQQRHHEQETASPPEGSSGRSIAGTWIDLDSDVWDLRSAGLRVLRRAALRPDIAAVGWPLLREEMHVGELAPATITTHFQALEIAGRLLGATIPDIYHTSLEQIQHAWFTYAGTIVLRRRGRSGLMRLFAALLLSAESAQDPRSSELRRITGWLEHLIALPHDEPGSDFLSEAELREVLTCCFADMHAGLGYMRSSPDLRLVSGRDRPGHPTESARTVIYWGVALMILLMACTGLRRQSLLVLEVHDWMELRAGVFGVIWRHGKKGEEHVAVISPHIAHLLHQYVDATDALRTTLLTPKVFLNSTSHGTWDVMTAQAFDARMREFTQRHHIERKDTVIAFGSTLFRRTFTTRALYEGRSLEALRSQLGHTTILSTLLYSKLDLFEHPSQVRDPLDLYGRQALTLWKTPQRLGDLSAQERMELLQRGMARHQEVGMCRHDRCIQVEHGSPPPCSLCEHLVTGREFRAAWHHEEQQRQHQLQTLALQPGTEVLAAQLKGQLEQFQCNLAWVLTEPAEGNT